MATDGWTAARVRQLRWRFQLSQKAFADRLGVDVNSVRKWEQGKGDPGGCCRKLMERMEEDIERVFPVNGP